MPLRGTARGERGVVLPAVALVASIVAVAIAAVGYVLTAQPHREAAVAQPVVRATPQPTLTPSPTPTKAPAQHHHHKKHLAKPQVKRGSVYVVVFNNSNVAGLAGRTASRAQRVGWNVVATDNWYGSIAAPTVYYPDRLHAAAKLLAHDLGITRVKPAIEPMQFDRLTVILTQGYQG